MPCPACFQGVERTDAKPAGKEARIHGLGCYVAYLANGQLARGIIAIVPDASGWTFVSNRLLADEYARQGEFPSAPPDFMNGECRTFQLLANQ